jgi:hypothetical protein
VSPETESAVKATNAFVDLMASIAPREDALMRVAREANVDLDDVNLHGTGREMWQSVVLAEQRQGKVGALWQVAMYSWEGNPDLPRVGVEYVMAVREAQVKRQQRYVSAEQMSASTDHVSTLIEQLGHNLTLQIASLSKRMDGLEERSMSWAPRRTNTWWWLAGFTVFVLCVGGLISDIRAQVGVSGREAMIFVIIMLPLSAMMFLRGMGFQLSSEA